MYFWMAVFPQRELSVKAPAAFSDEWDREWLEYQDYENEKVIFVMKEVRWFWIAAHSIIFMHRSNFSSITASKHGSNWAQTMAYDWILMILVGTGCLREHFVIGD